MVKALIFKGDKKPKKRKRVAAEDDNDGSAPTSKALTTTTAASQDAAPDDDDSWVSADLATDISGPIIIVLPTDEPSCLSCDSHGKVFSVRVENAVDGDPTTAEPHDVRQVWVANKIAGTESFSFKGHHGKYLGCDKFGVLTASREAISPEEQFTVIGVADNKGTFALQTQRDTFLTASDGAKGVDIRGDGELVEFKSSLRIRMQARFKPKLKIAKEDRAREKISRKELEVLAGRKLDDEEAKKLKKARREGNFHEMMLDVKVKGKHDKFA
jgi:protein FRG1